MHHPEPSRSPSLAGGEVEHHRTLRDAAEFREELRVTRNPEPGLMERVLADRKGRDPPHITPKRESMLDIIIKTSSNENSIVLDCFAGSGTTYTLSVDVAAGVSATGTITVSVGAGVAVDVAGNSNTATPASAVLNVV